MPALASRARPDRASTLTCDRAWGLSGVPYGPYGGVCRSPGAAHFSIAPDALSITYARGSYGSPQQSPRPGGAQFYVAPLGLGRGWTAATLEYQVFFDTTLAWGPATDGLSTHGGKLPGFMALPAGFMGTPSGCEGGRQGDCASIRLMWRNAGRGEIYSYLPSSANPGLCDRSRVVCNPPFGMSLGRYVIPFRKGTWHTVRLSVALNSASSSTTRDGWLSVSLDGREYVRYDRLHFGNNLVLSDIAFSTFFGGDESFASKTDTRIRFRGFRVTPL